MECAFILIFLAFHNIHKDINAIFYIGVARGLWWWNTPLCEVMQCASVKVCLAHDINLSELEYKHHTESLEHGTVLINYIHIGAHCSWFSKF